MLDENGLLCFSDREHGKSLAYPTPCLEAHVKSVSISGAARKMNLTIPEWRHDAARRLPRQGQHIRAPVNDDLIAAHEAPNLLRGSFNSLPRIIVHALKQKQFQQAILRDQIPHTDDLPVQHNRRRDMAGLIEGSIGIPRRDDIDRACL